MNLQSITKALLLVIYFSTGAWAQEGYEKFTISGYVLEQASGDYLPGASVYLPEESAGTSTNVYGFYSLTLPAGPHLLRFSFVGFAPVDTLIDLRANLSYNAQLLGTTLNEVEVSEKRNAQDQLKSTQMSMVQLPVENIGEIPLFLGEQDILKVAQLMPGIQSGTEGTSGLFVRGGSPDQNLILLDGVPVYNANHLFGFFSVFNPDAIQSVDIYKGGFPARFGGRLSSVIDVRMKEGNAKDFEGVFSMGLVAGKFTLEGPTLSEKGSFMVSARRTYIDALTRPFTALVTDGEAGGGYFFQDFNFKVNHRFNENHRIFASCYLGDDKAAFRSDYSFTYAEERTQSELKWGNLTGALRWNWRITPKLFANTTANYSRYRMTTGFESYYNNAGDISETQYAYSSGIEDVALKIDVDYLPNPNHYVRFGGQFINHTFTPGVNQFYNTESGAPPLEIEFGNAISYADEWAVYAEDDWQIGTRFKVNAGFHVSGFGIDSTQYVSAQPRISMRWAANDRWSWKASYVWMTQYIHLLSNVGIGLPTDLWLPTTKSVTPMQAQQVALGWVFEPAKGYSLSMEGYYKNMDNVLEYKNGASFFANSNWEQLVEQGLGWSYGLEVLAEKKVGDFTGWIGYTLSWSWRQFEELNSGEKFPYRFDRRHDISVSGIYRLSQMKSFGLVWVYGTGASASLPVANYGEVQHYSMTPIPQVFSNNLAYYENRNGYRMPAYHRLDLSYNKKKITKGGNEAMWSFGVYNVYNRINPFFLYVQDNNVDNLNELIKVGLFPVIPYLNYQLRF